MAANETTPTPPSPESDGLTRRDLLRAAAAVGASGAALSLLPVTFAAASTGTQSKVVTGHLPTGAPDFVYLPVQVPDGVQQIAVSYSYDKPAVPDGTPGNSCDIGIFDERGTELDGRGFRGWSGGFRTDFAISRSAATPGYLPGAVNPGTWHVVLGPYQVAPQGMDYRVEVTITPGPAGAPYVPDYPPTRIAGRGKGWYRGDCHLHTVYSDGRRLPSEVAAGARAGHLDFMISTDHNTSASHGVWGQYAGDDLLILLGEEITTRNGHVLALGSPPGKWYDWRYRARDDEFSQVARTIRRLGGIVVPAHPYCPYIACQWKFGYADADAVEVWNGPWTADDESAVDTWDDMLVASVRGRTTWLSAMGNSDAHSEPQVIGLPQTVVLAEDLEQRALLRGIAAGHTYLAESADVTVRLTAGARGRSAGIGDRLRAGSSVAVLVTVEVSGVPSGTVRLITDEGQMHQESLPSSGSGTVTWVTTPSLAAYVRAEVRHPLADGSAGHGNTIGTSLPFGPMAAMTNPIFLGG